MLRGGGELDWRKGFSSPAFDQFADLLNRHRAIRVHETIVTHLHETHRQNVLKKPTHEFHDLESGGSPATAAMFLVFEIDLSIFNLDDATT